ncbi:MAG TPA: hypothetical protein VH988_31670 [Thermoanaerobaculia bacterium]|nr:hypothetical protein [Thermoanaerobaculia bacterium]
MHDQDETNFAAPEPVSAAPEGSQPWSAGAAAARAGGFAASR